MYQFLAEENCALFKCLNYRFSSRDRFIYLNLWYTCRRFCSWFLTHSLFSDFSDRRKFCFARDPGREGQGLLHAAVQAEQAGPLTQDFRDSGMGSQTLTKTKLYSLLFSRFDWWLLVKSNCAANFSFAQLAKRKSLGRSKPATNS